MIAAQGWRNPFTATVALAAIAGVAAFVAMVCPVWGYTVDDAFITFRYADNFVRGWVLAFNQAPPPAEGYTSILWTLIMSVPLFAGTDPVQWSKFVGLLLTAATAGVIAMGVPRIMGDGRQTEGWLGGLVGAALFLGFPSAAVHSISGMETALAGFLYASTAYFGLLARRESRATLALPMLCLLLGLTRPEANLFSALLLGLVFVGLPAERRPGFVRTVALGFVLPGLLYFVLRALYYGSLLPLPFYIKSTQLGLSGWIPTLSFLRNAALVFGVPLVLLATSQGRRHAWLLIPAAGIVGYFFTVDHIMGFGHRYLFPLVPVLALVAGLGVSARLAAGAGNRTRAAIVAGLVIALGFGRVKSAQAVAEYVSYQHAMESTHVLLGRELARIPWREPAVLAIGDAGAVPYYSRLETIDTYGLNDAHLARHASEERAPYVFSRKPTVLVLVSRREMEFDPRLPHEVSLWRQSETHGFDRRATLVFEDDYFLWILWRSTSLDADILEPRMKALAQENHALAQGFGREVGHAAGP